LSEKSARENANNGPSRLLSVGGKRRSDETEGENGGEFRATDQPATASQIVCERLATILTAACSSGPCPMILALSRERRESHLAISSNRLAARRSAAVCWAADGMLISSSARYRPAESTNTVSAANSSKHRLTVRPIARVR
jgi:hypothetical protein